MVIRILGSTFELVIRVSHTLFLISLKGYAMLFTFAISIRIRLSEYSLKLTVFFKTLGSLYDRIVPTNYVLLQYQANSLKCCWNPLLESIVGGTRENAARLLGPSISIETNSFLQFIYEDACAGNQKPSQVNAFAISVLSGFNPKLPTFDFIRYNPATRDLFNE